MSLNGTYTISLQCSYSHNPCRFGADVSMFQKLFQAIITAQNIEVVRVKYQLTSIKPELKASMSAVDHSPGDAMLISCSSASFMRSFLYFITCWTTVFNNINEHSVKILVIITV